MKRLLNRFSLTRRLVVGLFAVSAMSLLPSVAEAGGRYRGHDRPRHSYRYSGHHHHHHGHSRSSWGFSLGYSRGYGYGHHHYHRPYYHDTYVYRAPRAVYYEPAYCAPRHYYPTRYYSSYDYYPSRSYFSIGFGYRHYR